jgi:acyl-CoA thioesterase-1
MLAGMTHARLTRRLAVAGLTALAAAAPAFADTRPQVVLLGDSILAGWGLPPDLGPTAALQADLDARGIPASVRNAGVPGSTSGDGRGRMKNQVRRDAAVCVIAFGGNDRGRGYSPSMISGNLEAIIAYMTAQATTPILCGLVRKGDDTKDFNALYPALAEKTGVLFYPDLFAGVTDEPGMRQGDRVHPGPEGARVIAHGLAPLVVKALQERG